MLISGSFSVPVQRRDPESMTIFHFYAADATFVTCGSEGRMTTRLGAFFRADPRAAESNLFTRQRKCKASEEAAQLAAW